MINSAISSQPQNLIFSPKRQNNSQTQNPPNSSDYTRTSIFYVNDYHGRAINMERTITASNEFDRFVPSVKTDKLKLASGDIMLGEDFKINKVATTFLKFIGVTASAVGNHECDTNPAEIKTLFPSLPYSLLACNLKNKDNNDDFHKFVKSSIIEEHNGNKYGIIGTVPTDLLTRLKYAKVFKEKNIAPANINETIEMVQAEVDKLRSQGVNKIILLSHSGYGYDIKIAKGTEGIDVILGGHSHNLIKDVQENINLFKSKSGEPVIITQAGRDGKNFGVLNLEFDNEGIIKKVQNNVGTTRIFSRNAPARHVFDTILGKPEVVGYVRTAPPVLNNDLVDPSPLANFVLDAVREETGSEIAIITSALMRGSLEKGRVDTRTISELSPFKNKLVNAYYTEKELVDAIKFSAYSFKNRNNKPGLIYTSGLRYVVSKEGKLKELKFVKPDGTFENIDINNPRTDKKYLVSVNDYIAAGGDNFSMLNKIKNAEKIFDYDITKCVELYFRKHQQPVDIVDDGRIQVVD